jgi:peptidyl-prolyl cis-trans isomerase SurA
MKKQVAVIALVALAAVGLRAEIIEQVLVKVNGEIFTKTDLEGRQVAALQQQRRQNVSQADLENDEQLRTALEQLTPQILVEAVDEMLLMQRGKELGYRMTDEQFQNIVANIRKENKLDDDAQFQAALKQEGLTLDDLRKSLERQMIFSRVQQVEVYSRILISEEEAKAYYEAHRGEFTTPASLTIREILVETGAPVGAGQKEQTLFSVALDDEAKAKIEAVRKRALAGEDFAQLAATESAAASKANGGLIGPISEDELAPSMAELFTKMQTGEISEPVRTQRGYQIFKLESRTATQVLEFDAARDQIANKVFAQKRQGELERYLRRLRAQAIIEWKHEPLKKLYESRLTQPAAPGPSVPQ